MNFIDMLLSQSNHINLFDTCSEFKLSENGISVLDMKINNFKLN